MTQDPVDGLRRALEADPANHALRRMLADLLDGRGEDDAGFVEWTALADADALSGPEWVRFGTRALEREQLELTQRCLRKARENGVFDGVADLQAAFDSEQEKKRVLQLLPAVGPPVEPDADADAAPRGPQPLDAGIRFEDVGGLNDVKKVIHRRIILPLKRPGLLQRYKKRAGGGVLLYGPPGCGKTMLARATAGECGLPFVLVRLEEVLSRWLGESEQNLHAAFDAARGAAPCVLFIDEVDALGFSRARMGHSSTRSLVDQLLQELDAIGSDNDQVLVLAATNTPWDLDDALMRPGRFDRRIFVPPPDTAARAAILRLALQGRPVADDVDVDALAKETEHFSGADLQALVEETFDLVIEEALDTGAEPPAGPHHFAEARELVSPSTTAWIDRVKTYVEFANRDDRYKDVAAWLAGTRRARWNPFK